MPQIQISDFHIITLVNVGSLIWKMLRFYKEHKTLSFLQMCPISSEGVQPEVSLSYP